jgi:hypothetical protein
MCIWQRVIPRHKGSPRYRIAHGWKDEFGSFNLETLKFLMHFRDPGISLYFIFYITYIYFFFSHIYIYIFLYTHFFLFLSFFLRRPRFLINVINANDCFSRVKPAKTGQT